MRFIVASMLVGLGLMAPTLARAAATVDLDQWASTDKAWQNGNLNGNNSRYPEGGIVPFRLALEGLRNRQPLDSGIRLRLHSRPPRGRVQLPSRPGT